MTLFPRGNRWHRADPFRWAFQPGLVSAMAALLLGVTGCSRHEAPAALALTFDVGSRQEVGLDQAELDASSRGIRFNPDTLACEGAGDYRKFTPATDVVIRDERGALLGSAPLGAGRVISHETRANGIRTFRGCRFTVSIPLKRPARIYSMDVADGEIQRSYHITAIAATKGKVAVELD